MHDCATRRTPGSNGVARSFCRTRRCIRSPNGAASGSAAPTYPPSGGSRTWRTRWRWSSSTRRRIVPLLAPLLDIPVPAGTRANFGAGGIAPPATSGAHQLGDGQRTNSAGGAGGRRCALGRSDHARRVARHRRTRRVGAIVRARDCPAGVSAALGHALASRYDFAGAARPSSGAAHGRRTCRPARAGEAK